MRIQKIVCSFLLFFKLTDSFPCKNVAKMASDLIESSERPTAVNAYLCWEIRNKAAFARHFWNLKYPHTVKFVNEWTMIKETEAKYFIFIVDLSCPNVEEILLRANASTMFGSPNQWLLLDNLLNCSEVIPQKMQAMYVPISSHIFVARENVEGRFDIHLIYKLLTKQLWLTEYYGCWSISSGFVKNKTIIGSTLLRRRDIRGETLAVAFNVNDKKGGRGSAKYDTDILASTYAVTRWGYYQVVPLFEFLNATRENVISDGWGYFVNGSWNGMVGDIVRGQADIVGTPVFMTLNRMDILAYIMDPVQTKVLFVFREPPLSYQNNLFLLPFNNAVWFSLGIFLLILMIVIYINVHWEDKKALILDEKNNKDTAPENKMEISDVALMIVGAVTQQGSYVELRGTIGRLMMFAMYLACLFFFTAYSASIVALLQSSSKQIRTLADLLNSRLELGVENNTYNHYYFTTASDPVRKAIYEQKVAPRGHKPNFLSVEDGVKKLQKHPFAFNMDVGAGYTIVEKLFLEHEKCGLQEIAYIPRSKPWLTCSKASPYAELFKIGYFRIREHGMSDRANSLTFAKKPVCSTSGGSFDSVSIVDVYPALLMLLYGQLLASALLGLEVLVGRCGKKHDDDDDDDASSVDTGIRDMDSSPSYEIIEVVNSPYGDFLPGRIATISE